MTPKRDPQRPFERQRTKPLLQVVSTRKATATSSVKGRRTRSLSKASSPSSASSASPRLHSGHERSAAGAMGVVVGSGRVRGLTRLNGEVPEVTIASVNIILVLERRNWNSRGGRGDDREGK